MQKHTIRRRKLFMLRVLHTMPITNHILLLEVYLILGHIGRKASLGDESAPKKWWGQLCSLEYAWSSQLWLEILVPVSQHVSSLRMYFQLLFKSRSGVCLRPWDTLFCSLYFGEGGHLSVVIAQHQRTVMQAPSILTAAEVL